MIIYEDILKEFQKEKVKYVLVGGIAVNLHGAFRTTADLDILVEMSDKNLRCVVQILKKKGYRVRQPVDPKGIAVRKTREDWIQNKHMKAFNFYRGNLKEVDLIIISPVSYKAAKNQVVRIKVGKLALPVMSINQLIKMKKAAGRMIDEYDICQLKEIKGLRRTK